MMASISGGVGRTVLAVIAALTFLVALDSPGTTASCPHYNTTGTVYQYHSGSGYYHRNYYRDRQWYWNGAGYSWYYVGSTYSRQCPYT